MPWIHLLDWKFFSSHKTGTIADSFDACSDYCFTGRFSNFSPFQTLQTSFLLLLIKRKMTLMYQFFNVMHTQFFSSCNPSETIHAPLILNAQSTSIQNRIFHIWSWEHCHTQKSAEAKIHPTKRSRLIGCINVYWLCLPCITGGYGWCRDDCDTGLQGDPT